MKRIAKKALKLALLPYLSLVLIACTAEGPADTAQFAVQGLYSAALSNDGASVLIGSIQHGGSYWKTARNERIYNWNHIPGEFSDLQSVDIDPSSEYSVTGSGRTLVLWNALTGEPDGYWTTPANIKSLKLTDGGDYALVGLADYTARFFDVKRGGIKQTLRANSVINAVDVLPDAMLGLTGDDDAKVILWDILTGKKKHEWVLDNKIVSVALSVDGKYAFGAAELGSAKIWSTRTGKELSTIDTGALKYRKTTISQAVFSETDRTILIGEVNGTVSLIKISTGEVQKEWLAYSPSSRQPGLKIVALAYGLGRKYYAVANNGYLSVFQ